MDDFNSLIPWYQDDDPFPFQSTIIHSLPYPDQTIFPDLQNHGPSTDSVPWSTSSPACGESDLPAVNAATTSGGGPSTTSKKGKRLRKTSGSNQHNDNENPVEVNEKRALHRDIERQRRQEMSNLYASLRTLLPLEYIKGKRATTDHIHQAVNYIKHMESKIKGLEVKRHMLLRKLPGGNEQNVVEARRSSSNVTFTIRSCSGGGIEILMKTDSSEDCFPLSKVLNVLLKEGLTVVNCTYTKVDQSFHCTIQAEYEGADQMNDSSLNSLQEKLDAKVLDWKRSGHS